MKAPTLTWPEAVRVQIEIERAAQRMPVKELAERAGIHPGSMPRYMTGQRKMSLELVEDLARALGIDIDTFLGRVKERQSQV